MFGGEFTSSKIIEYLVQLELVLLRCLVEVPGCGILALDMSELGVTDLVSHTINTGDSPLYGNQ